MGCNSVVMLSQLGYGITETENRIQMNYNEFMTGVGFSLMTWVNELVFGTIFILYTIAYIHEQKYQHAYFRTIQALVPATWANCLVANIMFVIGIFWDENPIYIIYPIVYDVFFFMFGAIIYYVLGPKMALYYRWNEQSWWEPYEGDKWWELF